MVTDRATIETIATTDFVTLKATAARTRTFNLNVAPANAPTLQEALPGVWVELETLAGERLHIAQTNELGRFIFGESASGRYRLRTHAQDLLEITREVDVPSPSGEYDLQFTVDHGRPSLSGRGDSKLNREECYGCTSIVSGSLY